LDRQYFKYLDESIEIPKQKYAREKDILINSLGQGTLGRVHFFCEKANNIVVDQHLFILRVNENKVTATYM
jgi:type I restriction enzyme S subunit